LISVGAGIIVTRASSTENLGATFSRQLFNNPRVLSITSAIVGFLCFVPGMPILVLMPMSGALGAYAYTLWKSTVEELDEFDASLTAGAPAEAPMQQAEDVEKALFVDPMEIELGYGLIPLVDQSQGGDLLSRITIIRRQIASELGIVVPPIRIRDNMALDAEQYVIKIKGIEIAAGTLYLDSYLAMNPGNAERALAGIETTEPAFGLPAVWISAAQKETAELAGYTVVDTLSVLATHLTEVIHAHAYELLNRQEASRLVENAKAYASAVIEELIPQQLSLGQVLRTLQNLLRERLPIRDIVSILEILADHSTKTNDPTILTEYVRQGLARSLTKQYMSEDGKVHVITLEPRVEQMLQESVQKSEFGARIVVRPATVEKVITQLQDRIELGLQQGAQPVALVSAGIRPYFKDLIERNLPRLPVLSFNEIAPNVEVEALGVISQEVLM
jgi:flagellar biosynthesis protein FlhA